MDYFNEITISGFLGQDADVLTSKPESNKDWTLTKLSLANTWMTKSKEVTTWLNVVVWNAGASIQTLTKGTPVVVKGRLEMNTWKAKDGSNRRGYQVIATSVELNGREVEAPQVAAKTIELVVG